MCKLGIGCFIKYSPFLGVTLLRHVFTYTLMTTMQNLQQSLCILCSQHLRQWGLTVVVWMACCLCLPAWAQQEGTDTLHITAIDSTLVTTDSTMADATLAPWQRATEANRLQNDRTLLVAVKTNLLYWGVALPMTPNIGAEVRLTHHFSVACEVGLNPFKHQNKDGSYGRSFRHLRVLPEVRYWFCESFYRHFVGLHVPFVCYNFSDIHALGGKKIFNADNKRIQGRGAGLGISYGYNWAFAPHWNLEGTIGGGWMRLDHKTYPCTECGTEITHEKKNYWGLTQAGISLSYLF